MNKFKVGDVVMSTYPFNRGEIGTIVGRNLRMGYESCWLISGMTQGGTFDGTFDTYHFDFLELVHPSHIVEHESEYVNKIEEDLKKLNNN